MQPQEVTHWATNNQPLRTAPEPLRLQFWRQIKFVGNTLRHQISKLRSETSNIAQVYVVETYVDDGLSYKIILPIYRILNYKAEFHLQGIPSLEAWNISVRMLHGEPVPDNFGDLLPLKDMDMVPGRVTAGFEEWLYPSMTKSPAKFTLRFWGPDAEHEIYTFFFLLRQGIGF